MFHINVQFLSSASSQFNYLLLDPPMIHICATCGIRKTWAAGNVLKCGPNQQPCGFFLPFLATAGGPQRQTPVQKRPYQKAQQVWRGGGSATSISVGESPLTGLLFPQGQSAIRSQRSLRTFRALLPKPHQNSRHIALVVPNERTEAQSQP